MANVFPKWANRVPLLALLALVLGGTVTVFAVWYYFTPTYSAVGYMPTQPVPYSHAIHVEQLGLDCRYCHTYVDNSDHANIPDAGTCMNCHNAILPDSPALAPIRASYESGQPVNWVRIHRLPDFVYFNHSVHVARGVSCVECHGRVDTMDVVSQQKPLSMGWCLECHRNPEQFMRDPALVTDLAWQAASQDELLEENIRRIHNWQVTPPQSCSGCHR